MPQYLQKRIVGHPLAKKNGQVAIHRLNLWKRIGPGDHHCHWCGVTVRWRLNTGPSWRLPHADGTPVLVADHLNCDKHDNSPRNIVPSCPKCNTARITRTTPLEPRKRIQRQYLRGVPKLCKQCKKIFIATRSELRRGHAIFCDLSCYNAWRHGNDSPKRIHGGLYVETKWARHAAVGRSCAACGKAFIAKSTDVKRGDGMYCSKKCAAGVNSSRPKIHRVIIRRMAEALLGSA